MERPAKRRRAMQDCNSPRNSRRKLIETMRLGAEPEPASPRILRPNIGLIDLRMPKKLKPIQLFHHIWRRQPLEVSRFFLPPFHGPPETERICSGFDDVRSIRNPVQQSLAQPWI